MTGRWFALGRTPTGLIVGAAAIAVVSALIAALEKFVDPLGLTGLYLFAIVPVAIGSGFLVAGIIAVASFLTFAFFLSPPFYSFQIADSDSAAALVIAILTAYVVSELARRAHARASEAQLRAAETERAREELRTLADEQAALRRVATLVAQAVPTAEVFEAVTREVGLLCDADLSRMERFEPDRTVTAIAAWSRTGEAHLAVGTPFALEGASIAAQVHETGRPARVDSFAGASGPIAGEARALGIRSSVGCPIVVSGAMWGVIAASSTRETPFPPDTESRIADFTELAATAIANVQAREELRRVADEQAALRRVATLVAQASSPSEIFETVTGQVGLLCGADLARMERYEPDGTVSGVAAWSRDADQGLAVGTRFTLEGVSIAASVRETGGQAQVDSFAGASGSIAEEARRLGIVSSVGCPIIVEGRLWGVIAASSKRPAPFAAGTAARISDFTELVATAISNAESREELAASRARVVAASDETRRRIERDLHDGTQQRLVSLALEVRSAEVMVPPHLTELRVQLSHTATGLASATEELQKISRGIHPPILSKGGLRPALKMLVRRAAVPVELALGTDRRLPQPVEVGAYYVVSEALTNAAKHAQASVVHLDVEEEDSVLRVSIRDDGVGGADPSEGSGLIGLRDRVEALGGTLEITSPPGSGTSLDVSIPIEGESVPSR
jgi:signal transduction histidine kinase